MKYAFSLFIALIFSSNIYSNQIQKISDSQSITEILTYMNDNREDIASFYRLSDKKVVLEKSIQCSDVSSSEILKEFKKSFNVILRKFPDEDLPFEQAYIDMKDFLQEKSYKRCLLINRLNREKLESIYYYSLDDKIHLRVDNISPNRN